MTRDQLTHDTPAALLRCIGSKWWRMNHLYQITDKLGRAVLFKCNPTQILFWRDLHYRNVILKARQLGMTTFIDIFMLDEALFTSNTRCGIIAHNLEDVKRIFREKVKSPYDNLDKVHGGAFAWIKAARPLMTDSKSELVFSNGSSIAVGTSMRSGTIQYLHVSELGKICCKYPEKAKEIQTGALQAVPSTGFVFYESTAEGRTGYFFDTFWHAWRKAEAGQELTPMDFKAHFYPWNVDRNYSLDVPSEGLSPDIEKYFAQLEAEKRGKYSRRQRAWYAKKQEEMEEHMGQEYPSTPEEAFQASIRGAYYATQMSKMRKEGRITTVPYEPACRVNVAWDLGISDQMELIFHQRVGLENRIIDYFSDSGEGLGYYVNIMREKGYVYGTMYFPHDIAVRELSNGRSRLDTFNELMPGITCEVVELHEVADGIEAVRQFLGTTYMDKVRCDKLILALDSYQREWDDKLGAFKPKPLHDWASHPADAFRTLAVGFVPGSTVRRGKKSTLNRNARVA